MVKLANFLMNFENTYLIFSYKECVDVYLVLIKAKISVISSGAHQLQLIKLRKQEMFNSI